MFNLDGLFSIFFALLFGLASILFVILKLCGVLLLSWWWLLALICACLACLFLGANGVG